MTVADEYRPNTTPQFRRAARLEVELPGGQVRLELDEPTTEQVQTFLELVEKMAGHR